MTPDYSELIERWSVTAHGVATPDEVEMAIIRLGADDAALAYRLQGFIHQALSASLAKRGLPGREEVARVITDQFFRTGAEPSVAAFRLADAILALFSPSPKDPQQGEE